MTHVGIRLPSSSVCHMDREQNLYSRRTEHVAVLRNTVSKLITFPKSSIDPIVHMLPFSSIRSASAVNAER